MVRIVHKVRDLAPGETAVDSSINILEDTATKVIGTLVEDFSRNHDITLIDLHIKASILEVINKT